jgi:hypothetical protein
MLKHWALTWILLLSLLFSEFSPKQSAFVATLENTNSMHGKVGIVRGEESCSSAPRCVTVREWRHYWSESATLLNFSLFSRKELKN